MRKVALAILATALLAALIVGGGLSYRNSQLKKLEESFTGLSAHIAENLSDKQLVEQLFMFLEPLEPAAATGSVRPGAVFLNGKNIPVFPAKPQEQDLGRLSISLGEIERAYIKDGAPPPFIALDQEGGPVRRIKSSVTGFPSQMAAGEAVFESGQEDLPMLAGFYTCYELRRYGIHWPLGPVLDVLSNVNNPVIAERSFSSDPEQVARMAKAWLSGLHTARCPDAVKHFPGHGDTSLDSHTHLPVVDKSPEELEALELVPFRNIVLEEQKADAVMSAHILFPRASGQPATLSPYWLTEQLRKKYQFNGIIITDDLAMNAVTIYKNRNNIENVFLEALNAGADMLLYAASPEQNRKAAASLLEALRSGKISRQRLLESARRVLLAKIKYGVLDNYLKERFETLPPHLQDAAQMVIRNSMEQNENILRLESQLARSESVNDFLSLTAVKTLVDERPESGPQTSVLLPFTQRQVMIPKSYPSLVLYTDLPSSDPKYAALEEKFLKVLPLAKLMQNRAGNDYRVILHTGSVPLTTVLAWKGRQNTIIYTTHTPLPANRYLPLIGRKDYLITSFSRTEVSANQLVEALFLDKLPPLSHLKID